MKTGLVVIGRNEGTRLMACIESLLCLDIYVVYVDSGSTDGSVEYAKKCGVDTLCLDMSQPLSAARARNEGYKYLTEKIESIEYVHFLDGDCVLYNSYINYAEGFLSARTDVAIVAGQLRESYPEKSVYNFLCQVEWETACGEIESCGGIFTVRKNAFAEVGGFNEKIVAGEEPDLCYRLRKKGWKIYRISRLMAMHDANMTSFLQWWQRSVRSGYAYAYGYYLRRNHRSYEVACRRIWFWALLLPLVIVCGIILAPQLVASCFILYVYQFLKLFFYGKKRKLKTMNAMIFSIFTVIIKWPQLIGQIKCGFELLIDRDPELIEHK